MRFRVRFCLEVGRKVGILSQGMTGNATVCKHELRTARGRKGGRVIVKKYVQVVVV